LQDGGTAIVFPPTDGRNVFRHGNRASADLFDEMELHALVGRSAQPAGMYEMANEVFLEGHELRMESCALLGNAQDSNLAIRALRDRND
jgi:hypothetical protein